MPRRAETVETPEGQVLMIFLFMKHQEYAKGGPILHTRPLLHEKYSWVFQCTKF